MSRLIPAKPRYETILEESLLRFFEATLSDDALLIQRKPEKSCFLLAVPDKGLCLIIFQEGVHTWNPDEEAWSGIDHTRLLRKVREDLPLTLSRHPIGVVLILPDMPTSSKKYEVRTIYGEHEALDSPIFDAMEFDSRPLKETDMVELVEHFSPGGMPYEKGRVTDIQLEWRKNEKNIITTDSKESPNLSAVTITPLSNSPSNSPQIVMEENAEPMRDDDPLLVLIRQSILNTIQGRKIFSHGVRINIDDIVGPKELLPIILITAAENWTPIVVSKNGVGGFHVYLKTDLDSYTGYTVTNIEPSSTLLLIMPIMELFKKSIKVIQGEEAIVLDEVIYRFHVFIKTRDLNPVNIEMIAYRIMSRED